jgi:hypothetical protein
MSVTLSIHLTTPFAPEDRELLAGITALALAIASEQLDPQKEPVTFCLAINPDDEQQFCVNHAGHRGRHRFRQAPNQEVN